MPVSDVTLKLAIGNFATELTGPSEYVDKKFEDIVTRFLTGTKKNLAESSISAQDAPAGKQLSASEFVRSPKVNSQADVALLLGYFMEHHQALKSFTSSELADMANATKRPFGNPSDTVAKLTGRGMLMSAGDKEGQRAYALTASGEEYVESLLETKP
jgi:hypothetical protein